MITRHKEHVVIGRHKMLERRPKYIQIITHIPSNNQYALLLFLGSRLAKVKTPHLLAMTLNPTRIFD
jgi:hypothetical protein